MLEPTLPVPPARPDPRPSAPTYAVNVAMECLRGLAALWVFLFHIPEMVQASFPLLAGIAREGHRGVPVFFAISGYCIFAAAQRCVREGGGSADFLRRRLRRIYPTFWISLLVVLLLPYLMEAVAALKTHHYQAPQPRWLQYTALDWAGVVTLSKDLLDNATGSKSGFTLVNAVYWSLAVEVQFYFVMYAALVWRRHWAAILSAVTLAGTVAMFVPLLDLHGFFPSYWPAFAFGVAVRLAYLRGWTPRAAFRRFELAGSLALAAVLALATVLWVRGTGGLPFMATALIAAAGLWLLGGIENGCRTASAAPPLRWTRALVLPFVLLGQSSYSLYLLHGKLYQLLEMFVRQVVPARSALYLLATVGATVLVCYGFYRLVERRFQAHPAALDGARDGAKDAARDGQGAAPAAAADGASRLAANEVA